MKKGIDILYHNGSVNMSEVKLSGIEFIILRLGYRKKENHIDKKFYENYNNAIQQGIPIGVYIYSYALNTNDALKEAQFVLDTVKDLKLEYPIYIDMEDADNYKSQNKVNYSTCIDICETFCNCIENAGYYVGIYANLDWLNNKINDSRLDKFDKWVAQWSNSCKYKKEYGMWQYSSNGNISGIAGKVDLNYDLRDYPSIIRNAKLNLLTEKNNIYVVQSGDTLTKIAKKFNTNWKEIYNLNKETIGDNPNFIQIGQKLIVREE